MKMDKLNRKRSITPFHQEPDNKEILEEDPIISLKLTLQKALDRISKLEEENSTLSQRVSILEKFMKIPIEDSIRISQIILSSIINNITELDIFNKYLSRHNKRTNYHLLYKATRDGDKVEIFHKLCDTKKNTLTLIKTDKGRKFGGFTTQTWEGEDVNKKDDRAFIFSIDKKKVFKVNKGEDAIGCYKLNGPDFCGWQIVVNDNFLTNKSCYTGEKEQGYQTEEDYEINGGEKYFGIQELEVFEVKLE